MSISQLWRTYGLHAALTLIAGGCLGLAYTWHPVDTSGRKHLNLGAAYLESGRTAEAAAMFREALARNPKLVTAKSNLAAMLIIQGNLDEAYALEMESLATNPKFVSSYINLAVIFLRTGKLDLAESVLTKSIELDPNKFPAYIYLGDVYMLLGRPCDAITNYKKALAMRPDVPIAQERASRAIDCRMPDANRIR